MGINEDLAEKIKITISERQAMSATNLGIDDEAFLRLRNKVINLNNTQKAYLSILKSERKMTISGIEKTLYGSKNTEFVEKGLVELYESLKKNH
ncbi:MAG: hypothetical protein WBH03_07080 [Cyclobacteriaceae bacterium]